MSLTATDRLINERTTFRYACKLLDETGVPIPAEILDTLTLTLYDVLSGETINRRNRQDVLNANGVTVDSSGNLVWTADPLDNVIYSDTVVAGKTERHIALFEWTYGGGKAGKSEVLLDVKQLSKVPVVAE